MMPLTNPPVATPEGNTLYGWQVRESDGAWSLVGAMISDGGSAMHTPLVHRNREVAEWMRPFAQVHAASTGQELRFARFEIQEVIP